VRIAGRLVRGGRAAPGWIEIEGDRIAAVGGGGRGGPLVAPGLVDLQDNGAEGLGIEDPALDELMLDRGVTSYLATVITTDDDSALRAARAVEPRAADPASPCAGLHFEGPFLAVPGVHPPELLRTGAEPEAYRSPATRLVTLAPELPGALGLIAALRARGVAVALGHTAADAATAQAAVEAGARLVTHLFNAMAPLHHRAPGVAGLALADPRLRVGVIADGEHVDPLVLRVIRRAAGGRVVLVSDAAADARAGTLAGSAITLDEAVRRWSRFTGAPLAEALTAASERPARAAGLASGLRAGAPADLVVVDDDGQLQRVMRTGCWVR
jgi:N-acetylglucosamine-6-phosphate deacetylase